MEKFYITAFVEFGQLPVKVADSYNEAMEMAYDWGKKNKEIRRIDIEKVYTKVETIQTIGFCRKTFNIHGLG